MATTYPYRTGGGAPSAPQRGRDGSDALHHAAITQLLSQAKRITGGAANEHENVFAAGPGRTSFLPRR